MLPPYRPQQQQMGGSQFGGHLPPQQHQQQRMMYPYPAQQQGSILGGVGGGISPSINNMNVNNMNMNVTMPDHDSSHIRPPEGM